MKNTKQETEKTSKQLEITFSSGISITKTIAEIKGLTPQQEQELKQAFMEHMSQLPSFGNISNFSELNKQYQANEGFVNSISKRLDIKQEQALPLLDQWLAEFKQGQLQSNTFAFPSHMLMRLICNMFNGISEPLNDNTTKKPLSKKEKELLKKPESARTPNEKKEVLSIVDNLFEIGTDYEKGETYYASIVSDNPYVKALASMKGFGDDIQSQVEALAAYLDKAFGSEGMRHFLALMIGLEENGRQGWFDWDINEHMERLGYQKQQRGAFRADIKRNAHAIVSLFGSLYLTITAKKGNKEIIRGKKLFNIPEFEREIENNKVTQERIRLEAADFMYKHALFPSNDKSPTYTKLLKEIAKEEHREHNITIKLATHLSIEWRMNGTIKRNVKTIMDWSGLDHRSRKEGGDGNRNRRLKKLEQELNYMKQRGYLSQWSHNGTAESLLENENPWDCIVTLIPPEWLKRDLHLIKTKKEVYLPSTKLDQSAQGNLSSTQLQSIQKKSGISVKKFAEEKLGISRQMYYGILKGKKKVTQKISENARQFAQKMNV